ncbi:MAG TPA: ABC transporter permease [Pusillimonas sp.]|uniref:ABC transporter permease n=1 Tax=Pusillimonas sp. TaxID=3040095 RepID=UPI002CB32AF1|nr:ABC transporter permease [Pusillimonas sp.]HUH87938.1 ABC transporter permease [Pusillimonas sp.]
MSSTSLCMERCGRWAVGAASVLTVFGIWYGATTLQWLSPGFVPELPAVFSALVHLANSGELAQNMGATIATSLLGYGVGLALGVTLGLFMAVSPQANGFFSPLVRSTYSLPKTTLIPLLVLWFGVGGMTNIIVIAITAMLPLVVYTHRGTAETPKVLVWSALSLGTRRRDIMWRVLLPAAMPSILTGARVAWGFTLLVAISCEMIVSNLGIGRLIFQYGDQGSYDYMFAALFATIVVAYFFDAALRRFSRFALRWHETAHSHA